MLQRLDALIIDSDDSSRAVLECDAASLMHFRNIDPIRDLGSALEALNNGHPKVDLVFVSSGFDPSQLTCFLKTARLTSAGRDAAYILVIRPGDTQRWLPIAESGWIYLCAPYSADAMRMIINEAIHRRECAEVENTRQGIRALVKRIARVADRITDLLLEPQPSRGFVRSRDEIAENDSKISLRE